MDREIPLKDGSVIKVSTQTMSGKPLLIFLNPPTAGGGGHVSMLHAEEAREVARALYCAANEVEPHAIVPLSDTILMVDALRAVERDEASEGLSRGEVTSQIAATPDGRHRLVTTPSEPSTPLSSRDEALHAALRVSHRRTIGPIGLFDITRDRR